MLAEHMAKNNDRCGVTDLTVVADRITSAAICLLVRSHDCPHQPEDVNRVIPF